MVAHARAYVFDGGTDPEGVKRKLVLANPGSLVQAVRAGSLANEALAEMLAAQTFRAESTGNMLAKKPEVDLLLRLAGTTQISKAIRAQGSVAGERFLVINAARSEVAAPPEFRKAELPRKPLTGTELSRVESAALLDAQRG